MRIRRGRDLLVLVCMLAFGACASGTTLPTSEVSSSLPSAGPASSSPAATFEQLAVQFAYDAATPPAVMLGDPQPVSAGRLLTLSFPSPKAGTVRGYLIVPDGAGPFPAVLLMPGSNATPESFRPQALEVAARGAIAMVIDQSQTRSGGRPLYSFTAADRDATVATIVDLRRGIDVLVARADVDSARLGYWGFSHGAFLGGILAGVDRRLKGYVLQSGGGADYLTQTAPRQISDPARLRTYLGEIATIDPVNYVGHASPAALLLQNGDADRTYTQAGVDAWVAAASEPKEIRRYSADHFLDDQATRDAVDFLARILALR